jgi:hypothetical protein
MNTNVYSITTTTIIIPKLHVKTLYSLKMYATMNRMPSSNLALYRHMAVNVLTA